MEKEYSDEELIALIEEEKNNELKAWVGSDSKRKVRVNELEEILNLMKEAGEVEVPDQVKRNFEAEILKAQIQNSKNSGWSWMHMAAAVAILVIGFGLGKWSQSGGGSSEELTQLRNEIQSLKQVTLTSALQQHSASERILAVNKLEEKSEINPELLSTLTVTLNSDESPNVRYAALQALKKFIDDDKVRAELVKSLESQSDPLIQISLITILVEAEEKSVIAPLKDIVNKKEITPEVKQQAEVALKVLT